MPRIANEIFCNSPNNQVATMGNPNGLIKKAKPSKTKPLVTEPVSKTIKARNPRIDEDIEKMNAEQDRTPTKTQVTQSIKMAIGYIISFRNNLISHSSFHKLRESVSVPYPIRSHLCEC